MTIKSYIDFTTLLEKSSSTQEENRAFGLKHVALKNKALPQLLAWLDAYKFRLSHPTQGESFASSLYILTLILVILSFVLGVFSAGALLAYNGSEPVNVIYFIAMVVVLPMFTMSLSLISMLRAKRSQSALVHISPAFWMEKIFFFFKRKDTEVLDNFSVHPLLLNWMVIKRSQMIAWFFSLGLLLGLLATILTKDIAFAWSTTVDISPQHFHGFLYTLSLPWREFLPSAVPSLGLIEHSQYFRLGDTLSPEIIRHASELGLWWKFLAMATIFYALVLRLIVWIFAYIGLNRAFKKSFLTIKNARKLLSEMNEPIISTHASHDEKRFVVSEDSYAQCLGTLAHTYTLAHGWAIPVEELDVWFDTVGINVKSTYEVGGGNSLSEDSAIIEKSAGEVLCIVKAWEPPTMDFVDYIDELTQKVSKVIVVPIGTVENAYDIDGKAVDVWDRKLSMIDTKKVWLKR